MALSADPDVLAQAATIEVTITSFGEVVLSQTSTVLSSLGEIPVVPQNGDSTRRFTFQGTIFDSNGTVVSTQEGEFGFVDGEVVIEDVRFKKSTVVDVELPSPVTAQNAVEYSKNNNDFEAIPSTEVEIPMSMAKSWLIIANAQYRGQVRLIVDGVEVAMASGMSASKPLRNWMTTYVVQVEDSPITAGIEIRNDISVNGEINRGAYVMSFARTMAIPLNAVATNSEPTEDAYDGEEPFEISLGEEQVLLSETIPPSNEKTLAIASLAMRRRSGALPRFWLETDRQRWPKDEGLGVLNTSFLIPFSLVLTIEASESPTELRLRATASEEGGAMVRRPRLVLVPESAFKSFVSEQAEPLTINTQAFEIVQGLSYTGPRSLVLQNIVLGHSPERMGYQFLVNDQPLQSAEVVTTQTGVHTTASSESIHSVPGRAQNLVRLQRSTDTDIAYSFIGAFGLF